MNRETYDLESFSEIIVSWSLEGMKNSLSAANDCGITTILQSRNLSPLPFATCLISYHFAVYIVMLIEYGGFPIEHLEGIKKAIIDETCNIKNDGGVAMFSEKERGIMDYLIQTYAKSIGTNLDQNPKALTLGAGGEVLESIKRLYDLEDTSLDMESSYKFPAILNASISTVYETLFQEIGCKWEPAVDVEAQLGRNKRDIMSEFDITADEFDIFYESYNFSLNLGGNDCDWNVDIDNIARLNKVLTEVEIEQAKHNLDRAILNRIIVRVQIDVRLLEK